MHTRARSWLAIAVFAALPTLCSGSEASPEEVAALGMRLILQQDDDSFVRFYSTVTGIAEDEVRDEYLSDYRDGVDNIMATVIEEAQGGWLVRKVLTEAQRHITCTPVLPGKPAKLYSDGAEMAVVRMLCMVPEIRNIDVEVPVDTGEGELVQDTSQSWKNYLEDLQRPATVPVQFSWILMRHSLGEASGWTPFPSVFEHNMMSVVWALWPKSRPERAENYINRLADAAVEDDDGDPQEAEDE